MCRGIVVYHLCFGKSVRACGKQIVLLFSNARCRFLSLGHLCCELHFDCTPETSPILTTALKNAITSWQGHEP